jgi:hypothetical protein
MNKVFNSIFQVNKFDRQQTLPLLQLENSYLVYRFMMLHQASNVHSNQSKVLELGRSSESKAKVVGLYGLPGSGKTFLLEQLKWELSNEHFAFYEGSQAISSVVLGGLAAFQKPEEREKESWRKLAINKIGKNAPAVVVLLLSLVTACFGPKTKKLPAQYVLKTT